MLDILIRSGTVVDGSEGEPRMADVGIKGSLIHTLGPLDGATAHTVIDATGQIVCPGFVDIHTHADIALMAYPDHKPKLMQGVTTEVFSNCGLGFAPVTPDGLALQRSTIATLFGPDEGVAWNWTSVAEYLSELAARNPATNAAYLIPHGAVRASVIGLQERIATASEIDQMQGMVETGLREGAVGMSSGLWYAPMCFASIDESIALCQVVAEHDGLYAVHMRDYTAHIDEAINEVLHIARASGVRLQISHLAAVGPDNWGRSPAYLDRLRRAREEGIDVGFDAYPYLAGSTLVHALLPPWAGSGGTDAILARLRDPRQRERILAETLAPGDDWSQAYFCSVASDTSLEGRNFAEVAEGRGQPVPLLLCDLMLASELRVAFLIHTGNEDDVQRLMQSPLHIVGSDGLHLHGKTHPRLHGTFPRCLGRYVRDMGVMPLEQMVAKMTSHPARRVGLSDRGLLAEGRPADVVVFDPDLVQDRATYDDPLKYPDGIGWVLVNGKIAKEKGQPSGHRAGEILSG